MTDFAWIIPLDKAIALGSGGVASNYIVPKNHVSSDVVKLKGAKMWIVLRGQSDRCIAVVVPKRVERFSEGYYKGDFLIASDLKRSIRLTQDYDAAKVFQIEYTRQFSVGLHPFPEQESKALVTLIGNGIQVKLLVPNLASTIRLAATSKKPDAIASVALSHISSNFSLDQVWGSGKGYKLRPFANFALHLIISRGIKTQAATIDFLKNHDPLSNLIDDPQPIDLGTAKAKSVLSRTVDLDFTEIDPSTIYAREFIFSNSLPLDVEEALNKTEVAEKVHQDMLRDITNYVKSLGLTPYESESVDLMLVHGGKTKLFEIKSASSNNLISQSAKGAFQVACYLNAMFADYGPLEGSLILHKVFQDELEDLVSNALTRMHISYLIYDPSLEWPERIKGFLVE